MPMRMVLLLSGGIDSPVAGFMMACKGVGLLSLTGLVGREGDEMHLEKARGLCEAVSRASGADVKLFAFDHRLLLQEIAGEGDRRLTCVLCKRMLLRVAERLRMLHGGSGIILGDSLGQVASQTLSNMAAIDAVVDTPVIRPLIGLDKVDIIRIAERIGTYEISNWESPGCAYLPDRPATRARLEQVEQEEARLDVKSLLEGVTESLREIAVEPSHRAGASE